MTPRKITIKEQQEELRLTLDNLHDALQHTVESALMTVLQNQCVHNARCDDRRDEDENVFADLGFQRRHHPLEDERQV